MGIMGVSVSEVRRLAYRSKDGSVAGSVSVNKPEKKRKRLQYNFSRIGNQILKTKTSGSARRVLTRAKSQTVALLRKQGTGDYDETELRHAIIHARKMERIAKKKMKHLQEEERAKRTGGLCEADIEEKSEEKNAEELKEMDAAGMSEEEMRQLLEDLMREMEEMMKEMDDLEMGDLLEELSMSSPEEMDPEDLQLLKKKHRSEEMRDIVEANMKYLKALFNKFEQEKAETSQAVSQAVSGAVSLQLGGAEVPIPVMNVSAAEVVEMGESAMAAGGNFDASI